MLNDQHWNLTEVQFRAAANICFFIVHQSVEYFSSIY